MSTETKPLKLMPFTRQRGRGGQLVLDPTHGSPFVLPAEFEPLLEALERGSTLSKLVDQIEPTSESRRFRLIKRFLIFLEERDLLADRDYIRLAESLNTEYSWPTSILTPSLSELAIIGPKRRRYSSVWATLSLVVTMGLALASVALAAWSSRPMSEEEPSLLRGLILFLITFSVARSVQAFWIWFTSTVSGPAPRLDVVIEPISIHLRQDQKGRSTPTMMLLTGTASLLLAFGIAGWLSKFAHSAFELNLTIIGGAFAFFTEASPYARSAMTDLLRSLYSSLEERGGDSSIREQAIRRVHITACFAWILFLGIFFAVDVGSTLLQTWRMTRMAQGLALRSGFAILAILFLFTVSWLADLIGAVSYDDATGGQIRKLWRRRKETSLERVMGTPPTTQDLEKLPFLRQIPTEIRRSLLQAAQVRDVREGQAVCRQGDQDRNLFVVLEGRLAVARNSNGGAGQSRRKVVAWLDPGAVFGENAFFFGFPRSADIVAMEPGRVLVLPHSKEMKLVESDRSDELRVRIWFLQALVQSELFKELPSDSLDSILHAGVEQRFAAGQKVIQEGAEADACYFMVQGRASVTQKTQLIGKLNAGDAFGEISILFPGTLRTASIVADTDLITIRIDRDKFWKLLKAHLPLALEIERLGFQRLKKDKARGL